MCLKVRIKQVMQVLHHAFKQIPEGRQPEHVNRIRSIARKYPQQTPQAMSKLLSELQFRLKFLKVSYPNIDFNPPKEEGEPQKTQQQPKTEKGKIKVEMEIEPSLSPKVIAEEKLEEKKNATFVWKDGKLVEGKAEARVEVDFSNWSEGNTDPEMLKKHKQLLDRQHFKGPQWENKQIPKLTAQAFLETANASRVIPNYPIPTQAADTPAPPVVPNGDDRFQTVKR